MNILLLVLNKGKWLLGQGNAIDYLLIRAVKSYNIYIDVSFDIISISKYLLQK